VAASRRRRRRPLEIFRFQTATIATYRPVINDRITYIFFSVSVATHNNITVPAFPTVQYDAVSCIFNAVQSVYPPETRAQAIIYHR